MVMRNLLTVLNLSMLVLLAGTPAGDWRWWLVIVGAVTAALLWRLAQHERAIELEQTQGKTLDALAEVSHRFAAERRGSRQGSPATDLRVSASHRPREK